MEPVIVSDGEAYQKSIMDDWETYMADFEPEDMLTINIAGRREEIFYENIIKTPSFVRGAYYIGSGDKKTIDFWVVTPSGQVMNRTDSRNEGLFYFNAEEPGIYQFVFSNARNWEMKDVTFAIHFGDHSDDHATKEHLDPLHQNLNKALRQMKNLYSEAKFAIGRSDSHNITVESSMSSNMWMAILETCVIIALAGAQIYFIKRILDNKRAI